MSNMAKVIASIAGNLRRFLLAEVVTSPGGQIRCTIEGSDWFERPRRNAVRLQWQLAAHLFSSPAWDHTWAEMVLTAPKSVCQHHAKMQ